MDTGYSTIIIYCMILLQNLPEEAAKSIRRYNIMFHVSYLMLIEFFSHHLQSTT